jgi:hypothetical protein
MIDQEAHIVTDQHKSYESLKGEMNIETENQKKEKQWRKYISRLCYLKIG